MNAGIATERAMKRALDGTFTTLHGDGSIKTASVERDYLPSYANMFSAGHALAEDGVITGPKIKTWNKFSEAEDSQIIALRLKRVPLRNIARAIGRNSGSIDQRIKWLKVKGRL